MIFFDGKLYEYRFDFFEDKLDTLLDSFFGDILEKFCYGRVVRLYVGVRTGLINLSSVFEVVRLNETIGEEEENLRLR